MVAIDGKATNGIIKESERVGVKYIAAKNFSDISSEDIEFVSF